MSQRILRGALVCLTVLALASVTMAQTPQPVVRMGDWVEVGNEVWMNIIASTDIRYNVTHNFEFDNAVQDRAVSRDPASTLLHNQEGDHLYQETRFGVDFRYQKNLQMQVLLENQTIMDGNLIDDRTNSGNPGGADVFGRAASDEGESTNLERFWIDYRFPGTPLRMRVGADLWYSDPAGVLGDDDPRFAVYANLGPKQELEIGAWAVIQTEAIRIGRVNDNDDVYYVFHLAYKGLQPHVLGLDVAYFRFRNAGGTVARGGEQYDTVMFTPSWYGTLGPVTALLQGHVVIGTAEPTNAAAAAGQSDYDVFAWAVVAYAEANLGIVRPFVGLFYGSGDDDPADNDLQGFAPLPQREITLVTGTRFFSHLDTAVAIGSRDTANPARSVNAQLGGTEYGHTVGNPFNDRLGNTSHNGINTSYANAGTIAIPAGLKIFPVKGHEATLAYIYKAMTETAVLEAAFGVDISKTMYHEIMAVWEWTLNSHFDIRLAGSIVLPGDGTKDIAGTVICPNGLPCQGDDPALKGEARFRARF